MKVSGVIVNYRTSEDGGAFAMRGQLLSDWTLVHLGDQQSERAA